MKMKKNTLILILFFLSSNFSFSQSQETYKFESEVLNCIYQKYDSIGLDLKSELMRFENYLIETKQLNNKSGESYIEIFKKIVKLNNIPVLLDLEKFRIKNNTPENYPLFAKCFHSKKNDKDLKNSESKLKEIYNIIENQSKNTENILSEFAKQILNVLDSKDFENEFYRIWALNTFYFTADIAY